MDEPERSLSKRALAGELRGSLERGNELMRNAIKVLALFSAVAFAAMTSPHAQTPVAKLKIGVYDSRAVAVAYTWSKHNPVAEKMREHEAAKAAGDQKKVKELEAWGEKLQRHLHRQGFGRVPVDDLLVCVKERLPEVAKSAGVDAIVFVCDYGSPNIEVVDVTDALVALYDPSEKVLGIVKELRKQQPVDLDELE